MFTLDTITNTKYPTKKNTDLIFAESRELHKIARYYNIVRFTLEYER